MSNSAPLSLNVSLAEALNLTPAEAVNVPAVLDEFAKVGKTSPWSMASWLLKERGPCLEHLGEVCRSVAKTEIGRKVAAAGGF